MKPVERFRPATAEMELWGRLLRPLIFPARDHALARGLRFALVTPLAHFANLSFEFQTYLYLVFHRHGMARLGHVIAMPLIVASLIAIADRHVAGPLGALALSGLLALWYLVQAFTNRLPLLGLIMVAVTAGGYALAGAWVALADSYGWWADPLAGLILFVAVQTFSHGAEPDIPPRVSGGDDWVPIERFVGGERQAPHGPGRKLARMGRLGLASLAGGFDELWGSPRLLPVVVRSLMWGLGYDRAGRADLEALTAKALASGNPAIDGIGVGGARLAPGHPEATP